MFFSFLSGQGKLLILQHIWLSILISISKEIRPTLRLSHISVYIKILEFSTLYQISLIEMSQDWNVSRLHSSRMSTARALTVSPSMLCTGGCMVPGDVWSRGVHGPRGEGAWSWGVHGLGVHVPRGVHGLGGYMVLEGVIPACTETDPPVNRMTNRCKNITLPQTSFAGSNDKPWYMFSIRRTEEVNSIHRFQSGILLNTSVAEITPTTTLSK